MYPFSRLPTYSLPRPYFSKLHHHPTKECRLPLLSFFSTFFEVSAFLNFPSTAFCDSLCGRSFVRFSFFVCSLYLRDFSSLPASLFLVPSPSYLSPPFDSKPIKIQFSLPSLVRLLPPGKAGTRAQLWSPTCALLRFLRAEQSSVPAAHREPSQHPPPAPRAHPPQLQLRGTPAPRDPPRPSPSAARSGQQQGMPGGRAGRRPRSTPGGAAQPTHSNPPLPGAAVPARPLAAWGLASREARAAGRQSLAIRGPLHVHPRKPGQDAPTPTALQLDSLGWG